MSINPHCVISPLTAREYPPIFHCPELFHAILSMHTLYCACAQLFLLGQQHSFRRSGRAYSTHSTAKTVNSEVFQDANRVKQLMECKNSASKIKVSVYFSVEAIKV
jgi:hypothetical protein